MAIDDSGPSKALEGGLGGRGRGEPLMNLNPLARLCFMKLLIGGCWEKSEITVGSEDLITSFKIDFGWAN